MHSEAAEPSRFEALSSDSEMDKLGGVQKCLPIRTCSLIPALILSGDLKFINIRGGVELTCERPHVRYKTGDMHELANRLPADVAIWKRLGTMVSDSR